MEECEPRSSAAVAVAVVVVVAYVCPGAGLAPDIQLQMKSYYCDFSLLIIVYLAEHCCCCCYPELAEPEISERREFLVATEDKHCQDLMIDHN